MHFEIWNTPMHFNGLYYAGEALGGWSSNRNDATRYFTFKVALLANERIQQPPPNSHDRNMRITKRHDTRVWPLSPLEQLAEVAR